MCSKGAAGKPLQAATTSCSILPKIEWPAASRISTETVSPGCMNGVDGLAARDRFDHADFGDAASSPRRLRLTGLPGPPSAPLLLTVPEPMIDPAHRLRVLAAWATRSARLKVASCLALARPKGWPL